MENAAEGNQQRNRMESRGTVRAKPIKAAVLTGIKEIKTLERTVCEPAPGQVQIQIKAVGICGSDLAYWASGVAGGFKQIDFSESGLCEGYCGQMGHEVRVFLAQSMLLILISCIPGEPDHTSVRG